MKKIIIAVSIFFILAIYSYTKINVSYQNRKYSIEEHLSISESNYFYANKNNKEIFLNPLLQDSKKIKTQSTPEGETIYLGIDYALNPYQHIDEQFLEKLRNNMKKRQLFFQHFCFLTNSQAADKVIQKKLLIFINTYYTPMSHSTCININNYNIIDNI